MTTPNIEERMSTGLYTPMVEQHHTARLREGCWMPAHGPNRRPVSPVSFLCRECIEELRTEEARDAY